MSSIPTLLPGVAEGGRKGCLLRQTWELGTDGLLLHQGLADLILVWDSTFPIKEAESYLLQSDSFTLCNSFYFLHSVK